MASVVRSNQLLRFAVGRVVDAQVMGSYPARVIFSRTIHFYFILRKIYIKENRKHEATKQLLKLCI